jgi:uncharacterized short protein YbdD (DUF466 family)
MSRAHRALARMESPLGVLGVAWRWLRTASGDDAYERYLAHCALEHPGSPPVSRRAFYRESERAKWSGVSRCC